MVIGFVMMNINTLCFRMREIAAAETTAGTHCAVFIVPKSMKVCGKTVRALPAHYSALFFS